jgi:hypothetical protein
MVRQAVGAALVSVVAGMVLPTGSARADAIDGNWCSADGRSMSIAGPQIVTPGGTKMKGDYDRHGFRYVVPAAEKPAGAQVDMSQLDDNTIHVRVGKGPIKTWHRCKPTS